MPDAIVVGASIAGLAAAIALLRRGFAVTVVEHAERGAPGGAGLALTHAALLQLHLLGVSVPTAAIEEQCVLVGDEVRFEEARRPPADAACLLSRRIGSVRQGVHGPIASAEALTEMSGDASTAHRRC